jgi:hypothetical protein
MIVVGIRLKICLSAPSGAGIKRRRIQKEKNPNADCAVDAVDAGVIWTCAGS